MFGWKKLDPKKINKAVRAEGDLTVPKTRTLLLPFLMWFIWEKRTIFKVSKEDATRGFHLAYRNFAGKAWIKKSPCYSETFLVMNGREDSEFTAFSQDGKEIRLKLIAQTKRIDRENAEAPPL